MPDRRDVHFGRDQQHPGFIVFVRRDDKGRAGLIDECDAPDDAAVGVAAAFAEMVVADDSHA